MPGLSAMPVSGYRRWHRKQTPQFLQTNRRTDELGQDKIPVIELADWLRFFRNTVAGFFPSPFAGAVCRTRSSTGR